MRKKLVAGVVGALVIAGAGFVAIAWRPSIAPVARPAAASFSHEQVARGEALAGEGLCSICHTVKGGPTNAGGYPMVTPVGTIYSSNITPDEDTGIGRWSEAAFKRAMHEGIRQDGAHLLPAFPYNHYTLTTDEDVSAIYAYLMTRPAVHAVKPANTIPFPLNIRMLMEGWNILFFRSGRYVPDKTRDAVWNRGAYLAEGLGHCGGCHTPRNLLMAEESSRPYAGAVVDDWVAPPLTSANPAAAPWNEQSYFDYLRKGATRLQGSSAGGMSAIVHESLSKAPDADIKALAVYFASKLTPNPAKEADAVKTALVRDATDLALGRSLQSAPENQSADQRGARLFMTSCASCHYNSGSGVNPQRPDLGLTSAVGVDEPNNLVQVILGGIKVSEGADALAMPAFADAWSDRDVADVTAYLRASRTTLRPWPDLQKKVADMRAALEKKSK